MRYHNPRSGFEVDVGELDEEKKRFFDVALKLFRKNANWFEFEQLVFSYTSPIFSRSRNRADVVHDPLFKALKDMWLQLGIDQGFVAATTSDERTTETKARSSRAYRTASVRDVASPRKSPVPHRRGR